MLKKLSEEVLSQIEMKEAAVLSWGFIGGTFNGLDEIQSIINNPPTPIIKDLWEALKLTGVTAEDILKKLEDENLIIGRGHIYRSRFAETIRLLYLLKQRFKLNDWKDASSLVNGIKLQLKYRRYPKRDKDINYIINTLNNDGLYDEYKIKILNLLLEDGTMKLGNFQVNSTSSILKNSNSNYDSAIIVGAGTGSGKTKSFYIPAFMQIAKSIESDESRYNRALAIYPRTELLKDQFKESLTEIEKLNNFMLNNGQRKITIGAYYGDTSRNAKDVIEENGYYSWKENKNKDGYIYPSMTCPKCGSNLIWKKDDISKEIEENKEGNYGSYEKLVCEDCNYFISNENIMLTRERMKKFPPDLLFTTTEMLNRKMVSLDEQHIFGINKGKLPLFLLLDEVHIYEGINGANVAYVIRRWRNLIRKYNKYSAIQYVGLSATLTEPKEFFSALVGINENNTIYITPQEDELIDEGIEYNAVLRGDPMSESSLLSTTVQTTMLLSRVLDPLNIDNKSTPWGPKVFGFTDKLDVINRWYHIQYDTEDKKLSSLRDQDVLIKNKYTKSTLALLNTYGQLWNISKRMDKYYLTNPVKVGITSSQTKGVDPDAKIVMATSTLEVGFNDPKVGAVIQHKSPRSMASFLQRKGRGGRVRGMRPWTIVVTSAYGRDRWTYENPELLFSPNIPKLNLPIQNTYVQHIQGSFALMDYLSYKLYEKGFKNANIWNILTPYKKDTNGVTVKQKDIIIKLLEDILSGNNNEVFEFIRNSLAIDEVSLTKVLWYPPRAIISNLIPSLLSQLKTNFSQITKENTLVSPNRDELDRRPLAGFVPSTLFSNIEEEGVSILVPNKKNEEEMGLRAGMTEFAPGNVSKRYAKLDNINSAHWIPLPSDSTIINLHNNENIKVYYLDTISTKDGNIKVFRPNKFILKQIPNNIITDKSSSRLNWSVDIKPNGLEISEENKGKQIQLPNNSLLKNIVEKIEYFTGENNQHILITRYAKDINANLKYKDGKSEAKKYSFMESETSQQMEALGLQIYCDGISLKYKIPQLIDLKKKDNWKEILSGLRSDYYLHILKEDEYLSLNLSVFEIEWLWQITMSSTVAIATSTGKDIKYAIEFYKNNIIKITNRTLDAIFHTFENKEDEEDGGKLRERLINYLSDNNIAEIILNKLHVLHNSIDEDNNEVFWNWIKEKYISTIASSTKVTIDKVFEDMNTEDLVVDIWEDRIWISEPDSGGMGVISRISNTIRNYPKKFEDMLLNVLESCNKGELATNLNAVVKNIDNTNLKLDFELIREEKNIEKQKKLINDLQKHLFELGLPPKQDFIVTMMSKILNSNSSKESDELIKILHELWQKEQIRLNCKFDYRVFTVTSLSENVNDKYKIKDKADKLLERVYSKDEITETQRFLLVESMMWSDCEDSCPDCTQIYSPYSEFEKPSRVLLYNLIDKSYEEISYHDYEWKEKLTTFLKQDIKCRIIVSIQDKIKFSREILDIINVPIEIDFELLYPYIKATKTIGGKYYIDIAIREGING